MADRMTIGSVEVRAFADVVPPPMDPAQFFPDVTADDWAPHRADHLTPEGRIPLNMGFFLVRSSGSTILVDTGLGPGPHAGFGGISGGLMEGLRTAGVGPDDVDVVFITHLHGDHIGWNVAMEGDRPRARFPRARYLVPRGDWEHFSRPEVLESQPAVQANVVPLHELGVMDLVGGGHAITPEVSALDTPGHTPGHLSIVIASGGEKGIVLGDLLHSSAQFTEPEWCAGADMDKPTARKSRRETLDRLEQEGFKIAAGHLRVESNLGTLVRVEGRRLWRLL